MEECDFIAIICRWLPTFEIQKGGWGHPQFAGNVWVTICTLGAPNIQISSSLYHKTVQWNTWRVMMPCLFSAYLQPFSSAWLPVVRGEWWDWSYNSPMVYVNIEGTCKCKVCMYVCMYVCFVLPYCNCSGVLSCVSSRSLHFCNWYIGYWSGWENLHNTSYIESGQSYQQPWKRMYGL